MSDQNPADKLTRRLPHATGPVRLNLPNRQTFYITPKRVPPKVLALFVDSILGKVDYGKLLGKEALLLHFDRSSRFLPPVCITPFNPFADWISVISTAFYKASRLSYFPTIPSLVSPMWLLNMILHIFYAGKAQSSKQTKLKCFEPDKMVSELIPELER